MCGGKTRFRFDDLEGRGTYYCNRCGAGSGLQLVMKFRSWDFRTTACEIDRIIGADAPKPQPDPRKRATCERRRRRIERIINGAIDPDVADAYLTRRGLSVTSLVLLGHPACEYYDDDGSLVGQFPAVIAPIMNAAGTLQSIERIYDANLDPRKKIMPPVDTITGAAIRLFHPADELGIAEGVETALAAFELFHVPVWSVLCADGMKHFEPPATVQRLIVFADNDRSFVGQARAFTLAERLHKTNPAISVEVRCPPRAGDWLDVLRWSH
jgi:putative DNA primase/helicase